MGQNSPIIFGDWLKRRRKALDLTQEELAKSAGCSVGALRKIEMGERKPSKQLAGLLAKALKISTEEQTTFVRVARGELILERLGNSLLEIALPVPDIASLHQFHPRRSINGEVVTTTPYLRIPLPATPLIGREAELASMERIFKDPQCRLLTLTGIGGIGKTRLAIEFGLRMQEDFPGGVYYFPLTSVNSPEKIVPAMADILGFGFSGPADPKEQLLSYLSSQIRQEALFIFDNLEHLLIQNSIQDERSSIIALTTELLQRLMNVKILGTSRERLNMHDEWSYELHGLSVPPASFTGQVEEYNSINMFVKSAARIRADYQISADDRQYLVQISQLVDGVPLALELAAAWVGILSCREIAQEIKSNMDFLTTTMRNIPERHRSIRATFDHSWKLLSDEERMVLCQLAVFQGGFDRVAAQQVAGASLLLLASLCNKSLVRRMEDGRYDLHEVIRQYAIAYLDESPFNLATYSRHSEYYLTFLWKHESRLKTSSQQEAIQQLTGEIDNIRSAWIWAIGHSKFSQLNRAGRSFGWYFEISGLYREGIEQLELLVQALKGAGQKGRVLGLALIHQGLLYFRKGEFEQAQKLYEEGIAILQPTNDQSLLADALDFLGTILHLNGEYECAKSSLEKGLFFAQKSNQRWFEAWAIYNIGHVNGLLGHYSEGYEQMIAGIAMWREIGDPQAIALGLNFIVPTLYKLGHFEEAKAFMHESIALCEQSKNHWGMGTAYRYLGLATMAEGDFIKSQEYLLKSLEIFGKFAIGWDIARSLAYLGDVALLGGNFTEARKYFRDALRSAIEAKALPIAMDALLGMGKLLAQAGKTEEALLLCGFVLAHPASEEVTKSRADQLRINVELKTDSNHIEAALIAARQKSVDEIVKFVLDTA
jgi:predicted ATPase/transcriptional regulator with XRE-family HTH domain